MRGLHVQLLTLLTGDCQRAETETSDFGVSGCPLVGWIACLLGDVQDHMNIGGLSSSDGLFNTEPCELPGPLQRSPNGFQARPRNLPAEASLKEFVQTGRTGATSAAGWCDDTRTGQRRNNCPHFLGFSFSCRSRQQSARKVPAKNQLPGCWRYPFSAVCT